MILSRSRRTRDPSTFLKWPVASEFQSQESISNHLAKSRSGGGFCALNFHDAPPSINKNNSNNNIIEDKFNYRMVSQRSDFFPEQHDKNNNSNSKMIKKCSQINIIQVANLEASFFKQEKAQTPRKVKKQQQPVNQVHPPQGDLRRSKSLPIHNVGGHASSKGRYVNRKNGNSPVDDEKWAGPAYSKSPPPSSLPFPKFSVQPMRSISMDLELAEKHENVDTSFATKDLKRILNLDDQQVAI